MLDKRNVNQISTHINYDKHIILDLDRFHILNLMIKFYLSE